MPIPASTLEQQFSSLSTDDDNNVVEKVAPAPAFVTPTKERDTNVSLSSDDDDTCVSESYPIAPSPSTPESLEAGLTHKTEHKLREERGELAPEPLLVENPHRFVLFPIQDNDVSFAWARAGTWFTQHLL